MSPIHYLISPRRSPIMGGLLILTGLGIAGGILNSLITPGPSPMGEIAFGAVFVAMLLSSGLLLSTRKGGMSTKNGGLTLHGCGDFISIQSNEIKELLCHRRASSGSNEAYWLWDIELRTTHGRVQLLGESTTLEDAITMARGVGAEIQRESTEYTEEFRPLPVQSIQKDLYEEMQVRSGAALFWPLVFAAIVSLWAGLAIIWIGKGILTFVAGPPLALLGLSLLGAKLAGIWGVHTIEVKKETIQVSFLLAHFRFFRRTFKRDEFNYTRIRPNGAKGWLLELAGPAGTCPVISGVTQHSSPMGIPELLELNQRLNQALSEPNDHEFSA